MKFEGSEKKLEMVFNPNVGTLRLKGRDFWEKVVGRAQAKILSHIASEACDAYLLSESSLFVWSDRLILITCGQTTLVRAADLLLEEFRPPSVRSFVFERKNEYFPHHQPSDFFDDLSILKEHLSGKALRFGNADEHHLFLYHLNRDYQPSEEDRTLEILMYDLDPEVLKIFQDTDLSAESIRRTTQVDKILPGFLIDDFKFDPYGYSLNALRGSQYYTIHVTPQEQSCYVSFETNADINENYDRVLANVLEVFRPRSFDTVYFHPHKNMSVNVKGYEVKSQVDDYLSCGYFVSYSHLYQKNAVVKKAVALEE